MGQSLSKLPTTSKEFTRGGLLVTGILAAEQTTGLISAMFGLPIKPGIPVWVTIPLFLFFLYLFAQADGWQRDGHLKEQAQIAEVAVKNGTVPPAPPEKPNGA